jgi:hypothetical protein
MVVYNDLPGCRRGTEDRGNKIERLSEFQASCNPPFAASFSQSGCFENGANIVKAGDVLMFGEELGR